MATFRIFDQEIRGQSFEVWVADGLVQYVVNGEIRHDLTSVTDFLIAAAKRINRPNGTDDSIVEASGTVNDNALENFQSGAAPVFDTGGTNPSINLQDDDTEVKIGGSGVGGSLRIDFGSNNQARTEAAEFLAFAEDLLGKAQADEIATKTGVQIGDFTRTVTVSQRDDDIRKIKFKSTGDVRDKSWADLFIEELAADFNGEQTNNGNVNELSYRANQLSIDATSVNLGAQGVGGSERYEFDTTEDAQAFFDAVDAAFGSGSNRGAVINSAMELIAESLGGVQIRNGNVSVNYDASQIKLSGGDKDIVDLGSRGVGGKEQYKFADQETAQKFIDLVRDAVGVEAHASTLVDEFVYKVSGGAGISGSPTFVGKDAFIEFIAEEFGGDMRRDGAVSESFDGATRISSDGLSVTLGPRGVGGKEIWEFETEDDASAFAATLADLFG